MQTLDPSFDYLEELFGPQEPITDAQYAEMQAQLEANLLAHRAEKKAVAEERARIARETRCPRCAGTGYLSQFQHFKGGSCFMCCGTGVFNRYKE